MAGKCVYIRHTDDPFFFYGCAANSLADPDPNTGGPALKRSDQQTSSVHQIESRPVEPVHGLIDECGNV